jgi:hypothetical protein
MSTTSDIVEQAIAKDEAKDQGVDTNKDAKDVKSTDDTGDKDSGNTDKDAGANAKDADKKDDAKGDVNKEEDGKFTADDALEVDSPAVNQKPSAPTDNAGIQLSPDEQKYLQDNLSSIGDPVVFTGKRGEEAVSYKVYDVNQLPTDFVPDSQVAFTQGIRQIDAMNTKAERLLHDFRQTQSNTGAQDYERRENEGIRGDVVDLQNDGRFPKFKIQPGAKGFDDTAEAKQMAEVLSLMTERNESYLQQYQQGRSYRHIGFAEAFELWEKTNPSKVADKKADDAQNKEDADRGKAAERSE